MSASQSRLLDGCIILMAIKGYKMNRSYNVKASNILVTFTYFYSMYYRDVLIHSTHDAI